jgi:tryptophan-rich sensory protein
MKTVVWTILFALVSAGLTWRATGNVSAGGAVLFGLWAIAGIAETTPR